MAAPKLFDGKFIQADLDAIGRREGSTRTADMIDAFLDELCESEEAIWKLTHDHDEQRYPDPIFSCELVQFFREEGYYVYRLKPLAALKGYRILYAYDGRREHIYLLAIVPRRPQGKEFADNDTYYGYESDHPISQRTREEYDELRLPKLH